MDMSGKPIAGALWRGSDVVLLEDETLRDVADVSTPLDGESLAAHDTTGIVLEMVPTLARQRRMLESFRQALPKHERCAGWEQAVLTAIDTRRELLAAVDEHVPGWDPARNVAEVVGHLAGEVDALRTQAAELDTALNGMREERNGEREIATDWEEKCYRAESERDAIHDSDPYAEMVTSFHHAMGLPVRHTPSVGTVEERVLGVRLLLEEVLEFAKACAVRVELNGFRIKGTAELVIRENEGTAPNLVEMTHELGDVQVIVSGRAVQFGLPVLAAVREEIHPANMRKLGPDGQPVRRADGKVVKPEGWVPANVARVVERALAGGADVSPLTCDRGEPGCVVNHAAFRKASTMLSPLDVRPAVSPLALDPDVLWTNGRLRVHASGTVQLAPHWDAIQDPDVQTLGAAMVGMLPASHAHLVVEQVALAAQRKGAEDMRERAMRQCRQWEATFDTAAKVAGDKRTRERQEARGGAVADVGATISNLPLPGDEAPRG